jgi:hypothetical protein
MHRQWFILACFFVGPKLLAIPIIQLSLEPNHAEYAHRILEKIKSGKKPDFSNPIEAGIIGTYAGSVDTSDFDGLLTFPRRQTDRAIHLLITPKAVPIRMFHNTLAYWELIPGKDAQMFIIEQKKNEEDGTLMWHTSPGELPKDNIIPLETVILFMKPKYAKVTLEPVKVYDNENLILPPVHISKGINPEKNALFVLEIRHFFANTAPVFKRQNLRYEMVIRP